MPLCACPVQKVWLCLCYEGAGALSKARNSNVPSRRVKVDKTYIVVAHVYTMLYHHKKVGKRHGVEVKFLMLKELAVLCTFIGGHENRVQEALHEIICRMQC